MPTNTSPSAIVTNYDQTSSNYHERIPKQYTEASLQTAKDELHAICLVSPRLAYEVQDVSTYPLERMLALCKLRQMMVMAMLSHSVCVCGRV